MSRSDDHHEILEVSTIQFLTNPVAIANWKPLPIWRFPKLGVPPNHAKLDHLSVETYGFWGSNIKKKHLCSKLVGCIYLVKMVMFHGYVDLLEGKVYTLSLW